MLPLSPCYLIIPFQIRGYRPLLISVSLPPSVVLGEACAVELVVLSSLNINATAAVTLHNPQQQFTFPDFAANTIDQGCELGGRAGVFVVIGLSFGLF